MPTDRELLQQSLDALERGLTSGEWRELIDALRARLAQPEQEPPCKTGSQCVGGKCERCAVEPEPVAWVYEQELKEDDGYAICETEPQTDPGWIPLYTAPPRKEWQSLTDAEKRDCQEKTTIFVGEGIDAFARAIEAKLKEKNT